MEYTNNYKCPACGGGLSFNPKKGKCVCEYCDSEYSVEEIERLYGKPGEEGAGSADSGVEPAEWNKDELSSDWGEDGDKMREYSCPSCGASILCEATTAATQCPYCDNPAVMEKQFSGALRPNYVIPFKVVKKEAKNLLRNFYSGKKLLPREFSDENHLEEIKGVYVPFWFFDGTAEGRAEYDATTSTSSRSGNRETITTKHYVCVREGTMNFSMVPADASQKMPDDVMDSLEPFDYSEKKDFSTAYLPGYLADKFDVTAEECEPRANKRCAQTFMRRMTASVSGYSSVSVSSKKISFRSGKVRYGLVPVWLLYTKYRGERKLFAVNGQTGKLVGKLPVGVRESRIFILKHLLVAALIDAAVIFGALQLF